jgi:catechol 2,3-dioxygenase-like lactoylglutathione lyase family enzyme
MGISSVVLDCANPQRIASFWCEAPGYRQAADADPFVVLVPQSGTGPHFLLQAVPEPKFSKNRMHVDVEADDIELEAKRLEGLGARRLIDEPRRLGPVWWIVMADPEGNEFCVSGEVRT